ncbi:DNA polymerase III subunit beta [Streptomyces sp. NPDC012486]|uniref:DNA polymerase III subunit beta n=1 Tax=unclassified Streptomyces TaxID=2593676 RepID=UPI0033F5F39C
MTEHATTQPKAEEAAPPTARFTVPYARIAEALAVAEFGVQSGVTAVAQRGVLLETNTGSLSLTTYDFATAVTVTLPADHATTGTSLLDHGQLKKALAAMVAGETKATAARTAITLTGDLLTTEHLTTPIPALELDQFVRPPQPAPTITTVQAQQLLTQAQRVLPAAGTDETLPALTGVRMTLDGQTLTLSATDRYRFAVADLPTATDATAPQEARSALIPANTLARLTKRLKNHQGPVGIGISEDDTPRVTLTLDTTTVTLRQLEGQQIRYNAVFPTTADTSLTVDRPTTLRALKKCHAMIKAMGGKNSPVTFTWDETATLTLAPRIGTNQEQARTKGMPLPTTTISGDNPRRREVSLNPAFLKDALEAFNGGTVTLHLRNEAPCNPLKPVLLTAGPHVTGEDYRHLLMPIRIN